jgi:hypothetical protein
MALLGFGFKRMGDGGVAHVLNYENVLGLQREY